MKIPEIYGLFQTFPSIKTDTREDVRNSIFVALRGDRFNGNDFAREALEKGAAYAIVDRSDQVTDNRLILVDDCLETLQQLATFHRTKVEAAVVAITGSNGKTTTKELVRDILASKYRVYATEGNLNNHIGVPLSLLKLKADTEFGIIEMGANHVGEISKLCRIAKPDHGLITNIGRAHIEGFGSLEGVKIAKGELYRYLSEERGTVFIDAGNQVLNQLSEGFKGRLIRYGKAPGSLCRGYAAGAHPYLTFSISFNEEPAREYSGKTRLVGSYNLENILAAACIGRHFNVEIEQILDAVGKYDPGMMRSMLMEKGNNLLVVDTYNANPTSMEHAIRDFASDPHSSKVLILGEMKEMGDSEIAEHENLIENLKGQLFRDVILVGPVFSRITIPEGYITFKSTGECAEYLEKRSFENTKFLLKGSRLLKLEELIDYI